MRYHGQLYNLYPLIANIRPQPRAHTSTDPDNGSRAETPHAGWSLLHPPPTQLHATPRHALCHAPPHSQDNRDKALLRKGKVEN